MDYVEEKIYELVKSFNQLPYLFIGTGLSMRYADAPSWDKLLLDIWKLINKNSEEIDYKRFKARIENNFIEESKNDLDIKKKNSEYIKYYLNPEIASILQRDFNKKFYEDKQFGYEIFSEEISNIIIDKKYDPFKYWISKEMRDIKYIDRDVDELNTLKEMESKIAGIITTNYDNLLEELFEEFDVIVGQENMLFSNLNNIFEIFKIHGTCKEPNTLVITKEDYETFDSKLKYLSAKLLTIFVEQPIIFIGYGLGDLNILKLLEEISNCLNNEQKNNMKDKFIFITHSLDGKEEVINKEVAGIRMTEFKLNDYSKLYRSFNIIQSTMPIKLIKKLNNMVCEYVYSAEKKNKIFYGKINDVDIEKDKVGVFIGAENQVNTMGFDYYTIEDILEDIMYDNKPFLCNDFLIDKTFKNIRSIAPKTFLPIYKYLNKLNRNLESIPENYWIIKKYSDISPNKSEEKYIKKVLTSIEDIVNEYPNHLPKQIANIKQYAEYISVDELKNFIINNFDKLNEKTGQTSGIKKLIALYDFKKYKK